MNAEELIDEILGSLDKKSVSKNVYVCAGRGRKPCPKCGNYVGVRSSLCECGHEFVKGQTTVATADKNKAFEEPLSDEDKRYIRAIGCGNGGRVIYTGAGKPPAKLTGIDYESVSEFCDNVVFAGIANGKIYMPGAIKNFARHVVGDTAMSMVTISDYIDDWYSGKVASTMGIEV